MAIILRFRGVKCTTDSCRAYGNSQGSIRAEEEAPRVLRRFLFFVRKAA